MRERPNNIASESSQASTLLNPFQMHPEVRTRALTSKWLMSLRCLDIIVKPWKAGFCAVQLDWTGVRSGLKLE